MGNSKSALIQYARWFGVLPAALLASAIVFFLWRFVHLIAISWYVNPSSWINIIFMDLMSSGLVGLAFVGVGAWVAPKKKKIVSYVLCGAVLVYTGMLLLGAFHLEDYVSFISIIALAAGAIYACSIIVRGDIEAFVEDDEFFDSE